MFKRSGLFLAFVLFSASAVLAQSPWKKLASKPNTLHAELGTSAFDAGALQLQLVKSSQTVAALRPRSVNHFDFTPSDSLRVRSGDGLYHLGDVFFSLKRRADTSWRTYSSAGKRQPVKALNAAGNVLAKSDMAPTFPADMPVSVIRSWERINGALVLKFILKNRSADAVEIGSLGFPMVFNNMLDGKTLEQAHAQNVFYDPYIGRDAGYLQVARLSGESPALLVFPYGKSPFEAYEPLLDDPTPRGITFEGFYAWMVHSKSLAETEWKDAEPWNPPTSAILKPGESRTYGLQFVVTTGVKSIEKKLAEMSRPVAESVPGYVLPKNVDAQLFLKYTSPVKSIVSIPASALSASLQPAAKNGWKRYTVKGKIWGRATLLVTYADGTRQSILYKIVNPEKDIIQAYGNFLTTKQWFDTPDPIFHRSPSAITYDNEKKQQVTQDSRAWIAGLSDEGGAGSWLGAMMKQLVLPDKGEIGKLKIFADSVLYNRIQLKSGPQHYGVRKSLFYYAPDSLPKNTYRTDINYKTWAAWPKKEADNLGRSYNYPHVAAAHWVFYRLARYHTGYLDASQATEYLKRAAETGLAMMKFAPYYAQFGQMEGTVFLRILTDLKSEQMTEMATRLEEAMKKRAMHWETLKFPFGSEMPWDSTGQEEVYGWSDYFGFDAKAEVTLKAILAYMPVVPHWAYNGNARRYWDFLYGGKLQRIERMIHHYGSPLNAIPVLSAYRKNPADFYLLRSGYGGLMGSLSNITQEGFAPVAFHAFPSTLKNDGISGDYGSGFFGYAVNTGTYLLQHPDFGWLAFGGNVQTKGTLVTVTPTTAARSAIFIAPAKLWITLDAGSLENVTYHSTTGDVLLSLAAADANTPAAYIRMEKPKDSQYTIEKLSKSATGAFKVELNGQGKTIVKISRPGK